MSVHHEVRTEACPRRVRGVLDGVTVFDTTAALYLFETGHRPVYYVPLADVDGSLLVATEHQTRCPYKGTASYWSIRTPSRTVPNAVWGYPEPIDDVAEIAGYVAFYWHALDAWFEDDEQLHEQPEHPATTSS